MIRKLEAEIWFELCDRLAGRVCATHGGEGLFWELERAFVGRLAVSARAVRHAGA